MRADKKSHLKTDKKTALRSHKRGVVGYSKKTALLEEAITQMNAGKYGRSSAALKELLALDPHNMEARRLFATLHLRLGSLIPARQAFDSLINEAFERQDYWLAESLLREYLAAGPRCVPFIEKLGAVFQEKGDALEAVAEYGKAIDILIEDPDPENPDHASQLYAKVRELAPASPVAFRLASSFDAQTGKLIASPTAADRTSPTPTAPAMTVEDSVASTSTHEPVAQVMPWEQVEDAPDASGVPPVDTDAVEDRPTLAASAVKGDTETTSAAGADLIDSLSVEQPTITRAQDAAPSVGSPGSSDITDSSESVQTTAVELRPDRIPSGETPNVDEQDTGTSALDVPLPQSSVSFESPLATSSESRAVQPTISKDTVFLQPTSSLESEGPSAPVQVVADEKAISRPMPWEDIHETTISIPDPVSDTSPHSVIPVQGTVTAALTEPQSSASMVEVPPDSASSSQPVEQIASEPAPAAEDRAPAPPPSRSEVAPSHDERSKKSPFSWESVFNHAWKFGDQSSAGTLPEKARPAETIPGSEPTAPTGSTSQEILSTTESHELREAYREPSQEPSQSGPAAPAIPVAPMPWDQVQETIVTIPPPHAEETLVDPVVEGSSQSSHLSEPVVTVPQEPAEQLSQPGQLEPVPSATSAVAEAESFTITQPPPARPSPEPEFRLVGMDPVLSPNAPQANTIESGVSSSTTTPTIEPAQTHELEAPVTGVSVGPQADAAPAEARTASDALDPPSSFAVEPSSPTEPLISPDAGATQQSRDLSSLAAVRLVPTIESVASPAMQVDAPPIVEEPTEKPAPIVPSESPLVVTASGTDDSESVAPPPEASLSIKDDLLEPVADAQSLDAVQSTPSVEASSSTGLLNADSKKEEGNSASPVLTTESVQASSAPASDPSQWRTGEVAVQPYRPTPKKRKKTAEPAQQPLQVSPHLDEPASIEKTPPRQEEAIASSVKQQPVEPVLHRAAEKEEWIRTGESIRFIEPPPPRKAEPVVQPSVQAEMRSPEPVSPAAAAVDVLFESSGRLARTGIRERVAEPKLRPRFRTKLARIRIAVSGFISSCFATTRAMVTSLVALIVLSGALGALGVGAVGLTWLIMEEPPSPAFQNLTAAPQRTLLDSKKNGYLLLLGFDTPGQDPVQAGYERKPSGQDSAMAAACVTRTNGGSRGGQANASANVANGWFRGADPVGRFKAHADTVKGWSAQSGSALGRYRQWLKLPFEDWGYGQSVSPPCASIAFAHQLYVADGFVQGADIGVDRLETDMEAWRTALGQAKTLPVKAMALEAIQDDAAVASGLLVKPDFDGKMLARLTKMVRPLDQVELSIRWPMQSELVFASKSFEAQLKTERGEELPLYVAVAAMLPLPKQRRFNDYAEYYEASYKAAGEGRYGSLPKWSSYIRFPANTVVDYISNPIENIVGLEPLPAWDRYNGLVIDTDAYLRLTSLQAWLRRGPQDADLLARIAKAGQSVYDPYTGLPMLVNLKKGVMYSVGHDGKDQDADPQADVVVPIPVSQVPAIPSKAASSSSSK